MLGIGLDGGADAGNVDVDRTVESVEFVALGQFHQAIARQHAAGIFRQRQQQFELVARQAAFVAVNTYVPGLAPVMSAGFSDETKPFGPLHAKVYSASEAPVADNNIRLFSHWDDKVN